MNLFHFTAILNAFLEHGVRQIYRMNETGGIEGESIFSGFDNSESGERHYDSVDEIHDISRPQNWKNSQETGIKQYSSGMGLVIPHFAWQFRVINLNCKTGNQEFISDVHQILKDNKFDFTTILQDNQQIKILRKIYASYTNNNLNKTSMLVRSYPTYRGYITHNGYPNWIYSKGPDFADATNNNKNAETLLLGDIPTNKRFFEEIVYPYQNIHSGFPSVIQLPHHGAKLVYSEGLTHLTDCFYHKGFPYTILVASYGITNHFGHPDFSNYKHYFKGSPFEYPIIRLVNERDDFTYTVFY